MSKTITIKLPSSQLNLLDAKASKQGVSRSSFIRNLLPSVPANKDEEESPMVARQAKSDTAHVWLTAQEKAQLMDRLSGMDNPPSISSFMRQLLRNELGMPKLLTKAEIEALSDSVYQLRSIGRNLNQISSAVNAGNCKAINRLTSNYLEQIRERIDVVAHNAAAFVASTLRIS